MKIQGVMVCACPESDGELLLNEEGMGKTGMR
jgi:hypothetical protein